MENAVAFMAAVGYLTLGLSLIFRSHDWSVWLKRIREAGKPASLAIGLTHVIAGTFIVAFHWIWAGLTILLTLMGAKAIFEGVIYMLFPGFMIAMLKWLEPHHRLILPLSGVIAVCLSLVFFCEWQKILPDYNWYFSGWI